MLAKTPERAPPPGGTLVFSLSYLNIQCVPAKLSLTNWYVQKYESECLFQTLHFWSLVLCLSGKFVWLTHITYKIVVVTGADITDYFNYGFNEETWRKYCQKQTRLRMENGLSAPKAFVSVVEIGNRIGTDSLWCAAWIGHICFWHSYSSQQKVTDLSLLTIFDYTFVVISFSYTYMLFFKICKIKKF